MLATSQSRQDRTVTLSEARVCMWPLTLSLPNSCCHYYTLFLQKGKVRPADKLQLKAATILPLVGLARSKQDPINRVHSAHCFYRPPPAGARTIRKAKREGHAIACEKVVHANLPAPAPSGGGCRRPMRQAAWLRRARGTACRCGRTSLLQRRLLQQCIVHDKMAADCLGDFLYVA